MKELSHEESFVDTDDISELQKTVDALLGVTTNPTKYQTFEVEYTTRGRTLARCAQLPRNPAEIICTSIFNAISR